MENERQSGYIAGDRLLSILLSAPALITIGIVTLFPLVYSFWLSLHRRDLLKPYLGQPFVGLKNYIDILKDQIFWDSMRVTVYFVVMAVALEIGLGLITALILNREFFGRGLVRVIALLPWAVPSVVNGIMWKWIYNPRYGALNGILYQFGLIKAYIVWLGEPFLALNMLVLADVWKETPFIMLLFLAALQTIPRDLYEAATVDGANRWQVFARITLPLLRPILFVALALRTIWALKTFDIIYTLTAGGPSNGTAVVSYYTYIKSFVALTLGKGAAVAYLLTFAVLILVIIYERLLYREVEY